MSTCIFALAFVANGKNPSGDLKHFFVIIQFNDAPVTHIFAGFALKKTG
jgi:hypothetical protein